jgi:alpha-amylase
VFAKSDSDPQVYSLKFENLNFVWQNPHVPQGPQFENGQKGAIAELFGWPYEDVEKECDMLGKSGFLGVKIWPPQEAVLSFDQIQRGGEINPWYFVYQPVSYRLSSRIGRRDQLRKVIVSCRSKGVPVYADAVVNHMTGNGNDAFPSHRNQNGGSCSQWGAKNSTDGSPYYTHGHAFEKSPDSKEKPGLEFPAVPFGPEDFHCERPIRSWVSPFDLNYGWLVGLTDLNTEKEYVQQRIADYFTDLLSIGVSGFRIDAAKHISPLSLAQIFKRLKINLGGGELPADFITWLEVLIGGERTCSCAMTIHTILEKVLNVSWREKD